MNLIVFDWDGTLMDSEARIVDCLRDAIYDTSLPTLSEDRLRNTIGLSLRGALSTLYPDGSEDDYHQLVERYKHHFRVANTTPSTLFDGATELIAQLHESGYFLAVATGKGRRGLNKALAETGLGEYFHYSRCADETHSKPHPQMLIDIMAHFGLDAQATLMIGDTEYDLQMANNAGVQALAVNYGVHEKDRLMACEPLDCVDSIDELRQWLMKYYNHAA